MVRDGESAIKKAMADGNLNSFHCAAHICHLLVRDGELYGQALVWKGVFTICT